VASRLPSPIIWTLSRYHRRRSQWPWSRYFVQRVRILVSQKRTRYRVRSLALVATANSILKVGRRARGSLSARVPFSESRVRLQKGLVYEGRIGQKRAGFRMDVLLLGLIDYSCRVQAVSLHEHESRRRGVLDRKDYFDVPSPLHG
jgi:hypothetical protein